MCSNTSRRKEKSLSDLSRLVALYKYGGLYLDADVVVSEGFNKDELFDDSYFRTHISFEDSTFNVDYYDVLGFKEPRDSDLAAVLNELSVDCDEKYLEAASTPGELVKIKPLVRSKLSNLLSDDEVIDDVLSENRMSAQSLTLAESAVAKINISTTLSKKIRSMPMGNA